MRKLTLLAAATFAALSTTAFAAPGPPTLHGFCSLASPCIDNNTNSPTSVNPPQFAFSASPGPATGNLLIDILVPNTITLPASYTFTGNLSGTATLFSSTAWTTGNLATYLGLPAGPPPVTPANPIGAYLPATLGYQPTATGFFVFQASVSNATLLATSGIGQPGQDAYLSTLGQNLALGSYIVGFITQDGGQTYGATANSAAILETGGVTPVPEPATWAMMLVGFGATGLAMRRSRRRKTTLAQIA
jgi:hypothetical protein